MNDQIKAQLQRAIALLQMGDKETTIKILSQILRHDQNNLAAWWIAAHALEKPSQIEHALLQVLRLQPDHPGARAKLAVLRGEEPSTQKVSQNWSLVGILFFLLAISVAIGVAAFVLLQTEPEATKVAVQLPTTDAVPTDNPLPYQPATLPATWTPRPTEPTPTRPPFTPRPFMTNTLQPSATPVQTLDPATFGDTYWEGDGRNNVTMDYYEQNGRYRRFYEFPVQLFVVGADEGRWLSAKVNAVSEISQIVPMVLTTTEADADIVLTIVTPQELAIQCDLDAVDVAAGCAGLFRVGGILAPVFQGIAYVANDTHNPQGAVLHELMHALGIVVHSPDPNDIMYFQETLRSRLSPRDLSTLRRLYAAPSYGDSLE